MLTLSDKKLKSVDEEIIINPQQYTYLDVSRNQLCSGAELKKFTMLKVLIIDNNNFYTLEAFPKLPNLETLSVNNNKFPDARQFLEEVAYKFPNLMHLSTMKNDMNPLFQSEEKYERYKALFANKLLKLRNLDGFDLELEKIVERQSPASAKSKGEDSTAYHQRGKGKAIGFQVSEEVKDGNIDGEARKLLTVIEYSDKYEKRVPNRNLRLKSEGNRFVKNDQL